MPNRKGFFDDIIKEIKKAPSIYDNIHIDIDTFLNIKGQLDKATSFLAYTEGEKQDLLKEMKHLNLLFAFARKQINNCLKNMDVDDCIIDKSVLNSLIQLSHYMSEIRGICAKEETIEEVSNELIPKEDVQEDDNYVWGESI